MLCWTVLWGYKLFCQVHITPNLICIVPLLLRYLLLDMVCIWMWVYIYIRIYLRDQFLKAKHWSEFSTGHMLSALVTPSTKLRCYYLGVLVSNEIISLRKFGHVRSYISLKWVAIRMLSSTTKSYETWSQWGLWLLPVKRNKGQFISWPMFVSPVLPSYSEEQPTVPSCDLFHYFTTLRYTTVYHTLT